MRFLKTSIIILLISLIAIPCFAEVPKLIHYEGQLVREKEPGQITPYPPGSYDVNFYICTDEMCTNIIWAEKHCDILVKWGGNDKGKFSVNLGEIVPLEGLDFNQDYWLLVNEDTKGYSKIEQLVSDPYVMRAEWANMAETVYDSETGEYKNLQDIVINNAHHAAEADNADTVDGKHYQDIANEIDADIAAHRAIPDAHHRKTDSFTELKDSATDAQIPDDITINYAATAGDADTVDGKHYQDIADEIDEDIAAHKAIPDAHHTKTTSFTELTDSATDAQIPNDITINYAATAGDADTLDGVHAADLEESAEIDSKIANHTAISNAHHTKTTSFTELTDMATDAQIPDGITIDHAATAGNADTLDGKDSADFISAIEAVETALVNHDADPDAHHTKTTSFTELTDSATDAQIPNDITVNYAATAGNAATADAATLAYRIPVNCGPPSLNPDYGDMYYDTCQNKVMIFVPDTDDWKALDWAP
ncbi:MAG: hypothetical protein ACMUHX_01315 [bacterium]